MELANSSHINDTRDRSESAPCKLAFIPFIFQPSSNPKGHPKFHCTAVVLLDTFMGCLEEGQSARK